MGKYGMPYMGSKSAIAEKIIKLLPAAPVIYDLFGGGGAITHCAILSGKYKRVVYNDLNEVIVAGFRMAINGGFRNETRWISRDNFHRLKKYDPYVAICFSFGARGKTYAYNPKIEYFKCALHRAVVLDDCCPFKSITGIDLKPLFRGLSIRERRLSLKKIEINSKFVNTKRWYDLQHLEALDRLRQLQVLSNNQHKIYFYNLDFRKVVTDAGIIYCDIPYQDTASYMVGEFQHDDFWEWVKVQTQPVYISSYEINRPDVTCIGIIPKKQTLSKVNNSKEVFERLYRYVGD